jgi:hypothetical protein
MFFVSSKIEWSIWLDVLRLIAEMNQRRIPVTLVNPFDYQNFIVHHSRLAHSPVVASPISTARRNSMIPSDSEIDQAYLCV